MEKLIHLIVFCILLVMAVSWSVSFWMVAYYTVVSPEKVAKTERISLYTFVVFIVLFLRLYVF